GDNRGLITTRDAATMRVRRRISRTRSFAEGTCEPAVITQLGLTGRTPRDPVELLTYAANASKQLRALVLPPPSEEDDGASFNPGRRAQLSEEAAAELKAAVQAMAQDEREDQGALAARDEAEDEVSYSYIAAADLFTADANAAGFPKIADQVRPTHRR